MEVTVYNQTPTLFGDVGGRALVAAQFTIECAGGEVGCFAPRLDMPKVCMRQAEAFLFYVPTVCESPHGLNEVEAVVDRSRHDAITVRLDYDRHAARPVTYDLIIWGEQSIERLVGYLPCLGNDGIFYLVPPFGDCGAVCLNARGLQKCNVWPFDEPADCDLGIASAARLFRRAVWGI